MAIFRMQSNHAGWVIDYLCLKFMLNLIITFYARH